MGRLALFVLLLFVRAAQAEEALVAVAANFSAPMQVIAAAFERDTGHRTKLAFGSTGKLYAQIRHGAPFDVLLSADAATPARLEGEGHAVAGTRFTYATGRLVLWSRQAGRVDAAGEALRRGDFARLALANPQLAPYGAAALEVVRALGLAEVLRPRFVLGENIAQAHQFVASGNAELGLVAAAQVMQDGRLTGGSGWIIPAHLHAPIRQDAAVLRHGRRNAAAAALIEYLRQPQTKALIRRFGYDA